MNANFRIGTTYRFRESDGIDSGLLKYEGFCKIKKWYSFKKNGSLQQIIFKKDLQYYKVIYSSTK